ncbi:MAG: DMT family transporter [Thermoanaerobaculia bacterium]|nr:DMT family transporter [Thermoanaerobaculia bacterium]
MPTHSPARLQLLAAALLFSTGGVAIKACELSSWQIASLRSGIAALTLVALLPAARRLADVRVWIVGISYALTLVLYVLANKLTTAGNAIFLQSTAPLYLLLLAPLLLGERTRRRDLLFMMVIGTGMVLFFIGVEPATEIATDPRLGNLLSVGTGISWAFTLIGLRWLQRVPGTSGQGAAACAAGNILAALFTAPMALPIVITQSSDLVIISYLGIAQIGIAYILLTSGIRHVPAFEASLLLLLEPVLNPVFAWLVHGERIGPWSIAGGVLILLATLAKAWLERARSPARAKGRAGSSRL